MSIVDYYNKKKEFKIVDYYNGLSEPLVINEDYIHTFIEDKKYCEQIINDPNKSQQEKRIANGFISSLMSHASNDLFEEQISKILGITNIESKHGWDGNDKNNNEPYEYKPTKIKKNYFGSNVNINDDSENKIHNTTKQKKVYNNHEANFIIAPINKDTSEFICIYKFKEHILYESRLLNLDKYRKPTQRCIYGTNINKCIELSKKYSEKYYKWHNPKFITP